MKFLIDENLSRKLADGMKGFGENVIHLTEVYPCGTEDEVWLQYVGENNLVVITRDEKIRWRPAELNTFKSKKVGAFFLAGKNVSGWRLVQQLVRNWPRIKELAEKTTRPYAFRVPPTGSKITKITL